MKEIKLLVLDKGMINVWRFPPLSKIVNINKVIILWCLLFLLLMLKK